MKRKRKRLVSYGIFYFNKVCQVLVKYSRAFVERPSQGTSSLASRLTTVSLDVAMHIATYLRMQCLNALFKYLLHFTCRILLGKYCRVAYFQGLIYNFMDFTMPQNIYPRFFEIFNVAIHYNF